MRDKGKSIAHISHLNEGHHLDLSSRDRPAEDSILRTPSLMASGLQSAVCVGTGKDIMPPEQSLSGMQEMLGWLSFVQLLKSVIVY